MASPPLRPGHRPGGYREGRRRPDPARLARCERPRLRVDALVPGVAAPEEAVDEQRAGQALGGPRRVVAERGEELAQPLGGLGVGSHPVELRLQLLRGDGHAPEAPQRLGLEQGILRPPPDDGLGDRVGERGGGGRGAVAPVHLLDGCLAADPILHGQVGRGRGVTGGEHDEENQARQRDRPEARVSGLLHGTFMTAGRGPRDLERRPPSTLTERNPDAGDSEPSPRGKPATAPGRRNSAPAEVKRRGHAVDSNALRCGELHRPRWATHSISTPTSLGRRATSTAARAGSRPAKYSA